MMEAWSIQCYEGPDGAIGRWYEQQSADVQEAFSSALRLLRNETDWNESPYFKALEDRGDCCDDLGEIMFSTPMFSGSRRQIEHRAIGFLYESDSEFVILWAESKKAPYTLLGGRRKRDRLFYDRVCRRAKMRIQRRENGEAEYNECTF